MKLLFPLFILMSMTKTDLQTELSLLDKNLREKRPAYYAALQAPLTDEEIAALEKKYTVTLPEDLRELYKWKNGQRDSDENFVNNSIFVPLEDVLVAHEELTAMIGYDFEIENWWNAQWLPVFENGGGSSICYDMGGVFTGKKGQLIEYWNDDNDRPVICPDLLTFIKVVNTYYKRTPKEKFDEYFDITDQLSAFRKKFIVDKPLKK